MITTIEYWSGRQWRPLVETKHDSLSTALSFAAGHIGETKRETDTAQYRTIYGVIRRKRAIITKKEY